MCCIISRREAQRRNSIYHRACPKALPVLHHMVHARISCIATTAVCMSRSKVMSPISPRVYTRKMGEPNELRIAEMSNWPPPKTPAHLTWRLWGNKRFLVPPVLIGAFRRRRRTPPGRYHLHISITVSVHIFPPTIAATGRATGILASFHPLPSTLSIVAGWPFLTGPVVPRSSLAIGAAPRRTGPLTDVSFATHIHRPLTLSLDAPISFSVFPSRRFALPFTIAVAVSTVSTVTVTVSSAVPEIVTVGRRTAGAPARAWSAFCPL